MPGEDGPIARPASHVPSGSGTPLRRATCSSVPARTVPSRWTYNSIFGNVTATDYPKQAAARRWQPARLAAYVAVLPGSAVDLVPFRQPVVVREAGMAPKVILTLEDDLDGARPMGRCGSPSRRGVRDRPEREESRGVRRKLAPSLTMPARLRGDRAAGPGARQQAASAAGDIRARAKGAGIAVSARGRIPARSLPN
jgi:hypothetical protein